MCSEEALAGNELLLEFIPNILPACIVCVLEQGGEKKLGDAVHSGGEMGSGLPLHKTMSCPVSVAKALTLVD